MKKTEVHSNNQSGGITAGTILNHQPRKNMSLKKILGSIVALVTLILAILTFFGVDDLFGKKITEKNEVYNVYSDNQSGGVTAGKIENVYIADKETLGIREHDGLYRDGKKIGTVKGFTANELNKTFTIAEIEFDQPLRDTSLVWQPHEFQKYTIQMKKIDALVALMPPGAKDISGNILTTGNNL